MDSETFKEDVFASLIEAEESGVSKQDMASTLALALYSVYSDDSGSDFRVEGELK